MNSSPFSFTIQRITTIYDIISSEKPILENIKSYFRLFLYMAIYCIVFMFFVYYAIAYILVTNLHIVVFIENPF